MNELDTALLERMSQIVNVENRPFCYVDFVPSFDLNGQRHSIAYGTYRNKISFFLKIGKVKAVCYSPQAFYTLVGAAFENPIKLDHTGVPNQLSVSKAHNKNNHLPSSICSEQELRMIKNHPVYRVIQNVPYERSALHDIRLKFSKPGIWSLLSKNNKPEPFSKDIPLKEQQINELNIKTTVHHTDKVSVVIGCSFTPVAIDVDGVERLSGALAIIQQQVGQIVRDCSAGENSNLDIPHHMSWIVTMWHFGADSSIGFKGDAFHIEWKTAEYALVAFYRKR